ncbi:MAG TPA: MBL fold metallo-hydrolase [Ottowia sp.]|jgi:phosphoribosyl 1,2-cyclic phosphodiesterase|uniref:MBL fold metallo-hydrolase n=1 Tax=Ottowia sp. TaxID=1898956 RepID=UPI001B718D89|nr:MBL fold metallo-hydrolase [Ottowia sp.]MBP7455885.1 MBL fold metallo-hydrolase [Ottowia sp.]MBP7458700.1 MBL fold metallo-hydrolase [Ottowia sp.]MBP8161449.1 MBL fold metallo-hydrolase [Ottowia sp.]MBP8896727.1 MBL fold metallo-hydrolase [Ottowia sp.]MBP9673366.1 MBL fold metallo-hydrolase [Ottowia sp.]
MLRFRSLASGSSGNATLIEGSDGLHRTRVLVDCGLGLRQLIARLAVEGIGPADLDGIFITHEHGDHIGCAPMLVARYGVPLWTSAGTAQYAAFAGLESALNLVRDGQVFAIGGLQLHPFTVPHDAREPLQLRCTDGDRVLGLMTDIGHVTGHALAALAGCHALVLESNHDVELLAQSRYPDFLKRRVGGQHGHLSNVQAAAALGALHHDRLNTVVAAHLSERNNRPELVSRAFAAVLGCGEADVLLAERHGRGWLDV